MMACRRFSSRSGIGGMDFDYTSTERLDSNPISQECLNDPPQRAKCLDIIRNFLSDISNVPNGIHFIRSENQIMDFLSTEMDVLTEGERFRVYGLVDGMFPKRSKKLVELRLLDEKDPRCLKLLHAIAEMHNPICGSAGSERSRT